MSRAASTASSSAESNDFALCLVATRIGGGVMCWRQKEEPAFGAAVEFTKETCTVLAVNAVAIPALAYWLLANALHLERVSRGMLATALELAALGVVVWRCRSGARSKCE